MDHVGLGVPVEIAAPTFGKAAEGQWTKTVILFLCTQMAERRGFFYVFGCFYCFLSSDLVQHVIIVICKVKKQQV